MTESPEIYAGMFTELSFISAVLGGFAFAAAVTFLAARPEGRTAGALITTAIGAAACFIVCALGWTLAGIAVQGAFLQDEAMPAFLSGLNRWLSLLFIFGVFVFFTSLGLSGFVRSRSSGLVTSLVAVAAGGVSFWVMSHFVS